MNKVKSFLLIFLAAVLLMSSLCACNSEKTEDKNVNVNVNEDVDEIVQGVFEAFKKEDAEKMAAYFYVPKENQDDNVIKKAILNRIQELFSHYQRTDYGSLKNIEYTACTVYPNEKRGGTLYNVEFVVTFGEEECKGKTNVFIDASDSSCSGVEYLFIDNVASVRWIDDLQELLFGPSR